MSNLFTTSKYLIAGHNNSGIPVKAYSANVFAAFECFESIRRNNYWANEIVKTLKSLSSGHIKSCVFINEITNDAKIPMFDIVMPGCKALVMKRSNGEYLVLKIIPDATFFKQQEVGKKPGLYSVVKNENGVFTPKLLAEGQIKNQLDRVVCVSERAASVETVSVNVSRSLGEISLSGGDVTVNRHGFDLHFTPGDKKIGGLSNIKQALNAATDIELRESATLLAATMEKARTTEGVRWISDGGGSGVLTQAMQILKDRGINLGVSDHYVFFNHLTTNIVTAERLARDIGLEFGRDTRKVNPANLSELVGGLGIGGGVMAAWYRFKSDPEHTALRLSTDVAKEASSLVGVRSLAKSGFATATVVGSAVGFAASGGVVAAAVPAAISVAACLGAVKLVNSLAEAWARDHYNKLKDKL